MTITDEQIILFWKLFKGRADAYGTYDPRTDRAWQVKEPVTAKVIRAHLQGQWPFGVYLLDGERTHAIAADFDQNDPAPPVQFRLLAGEWSLRVYMERSKRKGYYAWTFFGGLDGVPAAKARQVFLQQLRRIGRPKAEVFPHQQDRRVERHSRPTQSGGAVPQRDHATALQTGMSRLPAPQERHPRPAGRPLSSQKKAPRPARVPKSLGYPPSARRSEP